MLPSLPPFMTGAANPSPATGDAPAPSSPTPAPPPAPALAAHRIKSVSYLSNDRQILLQNENGPCPLLAAANCLLLRGLIELPARCLRAGSASIDDIINVLAERALARSQTEQQRRGGEGGRARGTGEGGDDGAALLSARHHLDEVLSLIPGLQHGMDLNPRFSAGPTGVEYTANLACFDLLGVDLVHGWLLDEQDVETASVVGDRTYNELVEVVISGGEAGEEVGRLGATIAEKQAELARAEGGGGMSQAEAEGDANAGPGPGLGAQELQRELDDLRQRYEELSDKAHEGHLAGAFLSSTSHQLTYHGLAELHRRLEDHVLCVFFRNNHFATLAKEDGTLYLLVTDLGYANVPEVVWEKLDVIDGSTDLYDEYFSRPEPRRELAPATTPALSPKDMVGQGGQDDADYRLAVELSRRQEGAGGGGGGGGGGRGSQTGGAADRRCHRGQHPGLARFLLDLLRAAPDKPLGAAGPVPGPSGARGWILGCGRCRGASNYCRR